MSEFNGKSFQAKLYIHATFDHIQLQSKIMMG